MCPTPRQSTEVSQIVIDPDKLQWSRSFFQLSLTYTIQSVRYDYIYEDGHTYLYADVRCGCTSSAVVKRHQTCAESFLKSKMERKNSLFVPEFCKTFVAALFCWESVSLFWPDRRTTTQNIMQWLCLVGPPQHARIQTFASACALHPQPLSHVCLTW